MRNEERRQEATRLRGLGMTYKAIGAELGVSADRARQIVVSLEFETRRRAIDPFFGLRYTTVQRLRELGYESRDACRALANDDVARNSMRGTTWAKLTLRMVNEIRGWLCVAPLNSAVTPETLEQAKNLLEKHGYRVEYPAR